MQMQDIQETVKVTLSLISESKRQTTTTNSNIDHCERERQTRQLKDSGRTVMELDKPTSLDNIFHKII